MVLPRQAEPACQKMPDIQSQGMQRLRRSTFKNSTGQLHPRQFSPCKASLREGRRRGGGKGHSPWARTVRTAVMIEAGPHINIEAGIAPFRHQGFNGANQGPSVHKPCVKLIPKCSTIVRLLTRKTDKGTQGRKKLRQIFSAGRLRAGKRPDPYLRGRQISRRIQHPEPGCCSGSREGNLKRLKRVRLLRI
ncbi:hypothetical protein Amal_03702 [Acetobacter malorum]|uniref:Uncharacterized protein n=1 Tax=Acetobacter malorum TaxID=178901 RepID=A0A177G4A4_9PROT|nr:hypothetical protein Amal_03702 [Acetobacter malorum]